MQALKAHLRNGHFVIDESTDLPEGTEVELQNSWSSCEPRMLEGRTIEAGSASGHTNRRALAKAS